MIKAINAKKFLSFLKSLALTLAVGGLSAILTRGENSFYETLILPPLAPPSIVFPIVWTILYVLMGISLYLAKPLTKDTKLSFALLLLCLFLWPIIFFVFKSLSFSFLWIVLTLIVCFITVIKFYRQNKTAGLLLVPLLIWILFATYLNGAIFFLN